MEISIKQNVKIANDKYPHYWKTEYESDIIPHVGDYIEDPIWKKPYTYKVTEVVIDYFKNKCFVCVETYDGEIPEERKESFADMAKIHGWAASWKMLE